MKLTSTNYEIIAGERRWRAAQLIGLKHVPCIVGQYTVEQASHIAIVENTQRENLNVIDEAFAINRIVLEFEYTHSVIGAIVGKSRSEISNLLRLLKLDKRVQEYLQKGELLEAHGKILAGLPIEKQCFFANLCIEQKWSSRKLDDAIKQKNKVKKEKFQIKKDINIQSLERNVSNCFGHLIDITFKKNNVGSLNVNFFNLDDLQNILEKLGYSSK